MRGKNSLTSARLAKNALALAYDALQGNAEYGEKLLGEALAHCVDAVNFARQERLAKGKHCGEEWCDRATGCCSCGCGNCQEASRNER